MEIKTKYNVGDKVFYIKDGEIIQEEIEGIRVRIVADDLIIEYVFTVPFLFKNSYIKEDKCFELKEDLIKSL